MTEREVLQLALEALEVNLGTWSAKKKAIPAIKEVLAQPEPVIDKSAAVRIATALGWEPKRKPLTDEQWQVMADTLGCCITRTQKDAIEAVIGIKDKT